MIFEVVPEAQRFDLDAGDFAYPGFRKQKSPK